MSKRVGKGWQRSVGFTLVEILIGVALLSMLGLVFITLLRGGSRESHLSADHFTGAMLSQKVVEDLIDETELNPRALFALGIDESSPLPPTAVVDGQAPFFQHVEDRVAPFGKIDIQAEGGIDQAMSPLFGQVETFQVAADGRRLAGAGGISEKRHLQEVLVDFSWKSKVGRGSVNSAIHLFAPVDAKPASIALIFNASQVEQEAAWAFFDAPGDSLAQLVTDSGANYATVFGLGVVHLVSQGFIQSDAMRNCLQAVTTGKTAAQGPFSGVVAEYQAQQKLGKAYFDLANTAFLMTYALATQVIELADICDAARVGTILADQPEVFTPGLGNYLKLSETFRDAVVKARQTYRELLRPGLSGVRGMKQQAFVIRRLIGLFRILAVIPEHSGGLAEYRVFLNDLAEEMTGRNPYLHRLLLQEKDFAQSEAVLVQKHPHLRRIQRVTQEAVPAARSVISGFDSSSAD
jgi:hypothetical protein